MNRHFALAAIFAAFALPSYAQTNTPHIDHAQANQQNRINNGVQSGSLTTKETHALQQRENKIEANEQAAKADGKVTRAERRKLRKEENHASRAIHRKKHNDKVVAQ